jgi:hypothetical protein
MKKLILFLLPFAITLSSLNGCKKDDKDDDDIQPQVLDCNTISSDLVLVDRGSSPDYIIPCRIVVEAKLTIEPGVEIAYGSDAGLEFRSSGILDAQGTAAKPIVMRGEQATSGYWRGLRFSGSNNANKLYFATIDGAGSLPWDGGNIKANIDINDNSKVEIKNCTISNSASDGIYVDWLSGNAQALAGFGGNTFSGNNNYPLRVVDDVVKDLGSNNFTTNGKNKIEVHHSRGIVGTHSWTNPGAPILINAVMAVSFGTNQGQLTIGEGVVIEMGADKSIVVNSQGALTINGTQANPVEIKSENNIKDHWRGIAVNSNNSGNLFNYANISGGGSASHDGFTGKDCIRVGSAVSGPYKLSMSNCTVSNSSFCGIRYSPVTATFSESNNTYLNLGEDKCDF